MRNSVFRHLFENKRNGGKPSISCAATYHYLQIFKIGNTGAFTHPDQRETLLHSCPKNMCFRNSHYGEGLANAIWTGMLVPCKSFGHLAIFPAIMNCIMFVVTDNNIVVALVGSISAVITVFHYNAFAHCKREVTFIEQEINTIDLSFAKVMACKTVVCLRAKNQAAGLER